MGGGIRGGTVHGATDEVGYKAVQDRQYCSDIRATIVSQMGLDYTKMAFQFNGRNFHLIRRATGRSGRSLGRRNMEPDRITRKRLVPGTGAPLSAAGLLSAQTNG